MWGCFSMWQILASLFRSENTENRQRERVWRWAEVVQCCIQSVTLGQYFLQLKTTVHLGQGCSFYFTKGHTGFNLMGEIRPPRIKSKTHSIQLIDALWFLWKLHHLACNSIQPVSCVPSSKIKAFCKSSLILPFHRPESDNSVGVGFH